jgi:hypothetical protein
MHTFEWPIEDIGRAHPDLYLEHFAVMAVALMSRLSSSPCEFLVECEGFRPPALEGDTHFLLRVGWDAQTAAAATRVWLTEQPRPIVEHAAVALAALTFPHLLPDSAMRVTQHGERADYWLPRLQCALEISGTEHHREVSRRHGRRRRSCSAIPGAGTAMSSSVVSARRAGSFAGPITPRRNKPMPRATNKPSAALIDRMLGEASWLLSHAQALGAYGRYAEAAADQLRAANCEEQVACLLDSVGQQREAAIHRVSAASCCEKLGQYVRAATLLRAALAADLVEGYRAEVEEQLTRCLAEAHKELNRAARNGSLEHSSALP